MSGSGAKIREFEKKEKIINRGPRVSKDETQDIIDRIPALSGLFTRLHQKFEMADNISKVVDLRLEEEEKDATEGMMYLSRLQSGMWGGKKKLTDYEEKNDSHFNADRTSSGAPHDYGVEKGDRGDVLSGAGSDTGQLQQRSISISAEGAAKLLKRRRIAMSLATLASKPAKHDAIIADGGISAIAELSTINDTIIHKSCASAFSLLAKVEAHRKRMFDEQALQSILNLTMIPIKLVRLECCKTLTNLMCVDGYESRSVRDGVAYTLMKVVSDDLDDLEIILMCFLNLTCVDDKYTRVEEVMDGIIQLSARKLPVHLESYIIKGLCNLSALKGFQQRLLEDGCMEILERAMKTSPDADRVLASTVVRNLTTCYRTRPKLLDHNIISMLVNMSRDKLEEVKFLAVKALYNLSRDGSCRERIVGGNAVTVILKISRETGGNIGIGRLAAKTLRVLCGDPSVANKLVGDGIVKALMSLLRNDDPSIQQYCAESICSLFQIDLVLGKLVEQGAVGVIVSLSQSSTEFITGEWCSFALYYLATNPRCPEDTLQQAILPCLIKLCTNSSSRTKYFCSSAFAFITLLKEIDTSEGINVLVRMLQEEDDVDTKNNCITSLYNSADVDENCCAMLEAGVLEPLLDLTGSENVQTRIECAAILCRLSLQVSFYDQFVELNVLKILLELSGLEHTLTQRRVIIGLSNLSADDRLRRQLFDLNPIPYIVPLAAKRDENLRRGCVSIVCNLASEYGTEKTIIDAGIIETLLITAMISSDQLQTKVICVKALINLMADPTQYQAMVNAGAVWSFSVLAMQGNRDLLQMCARALCCLSVDYADQMLDSNATVKTAMFLIQQADDLDLQRIGGRCLSNLLCSHVKHGYEAKDVEFRSHVVKNMHPLTENGDDECGEMAIGILCALSKFEDCKEAIVSSGMLRKIDAGNIFASKALSLSYLTMFGNIACNTGMRTKILNDRTIEKFQSMCFVEDAFIELTVLKTVYSLTCAAENLLILSNSTIPLLYQIWNSSTSKDNLEIVQTMVAIIYNLSTGVTQVQAKMVSHGVVDFIWDLWPEIEKHKKICVLACDAILHLGCGQVNTSRMVNDKCTPVLCFIADVTNRNTYGFSYEMLYRVSACMRNMLCVNGNQKAMVAQGCILTLMAIAHEAEKTSHLADPITETVQANCSAALRSLTYNVEVRDVLKEQGAIDFIMAELSKEDTSFKYELLVEVEAESWSNGARGTNRDGRAIAIPCKAIYDDMLKDMVLSGLDEIGESEAKGLDNYDGENSPEVQMEGVSLSKYHVKVELDEPEIEASEYDKVLKIGINELETITDPEENALPITRLCPKVSCKVEPYPLRSLKYNGDEKAENDRQDDESIDAAEDLARQLNSGSNLPEVRPYSSTTERDFSNHEYSKTNQSKVPQMVGDTTRPNSGFPAIHRELGADSSQRLRSTNELAAGSSMSWGNGESQVMHTDPSTGPDGKRRTRRKGTKPETPADRFDKLVGLIKASKKSKGKAITVDQVVDKWTEISRF
eukprot:GSChrysophyteH1.ASY1.ANO1.2260.1 assembled CDS